MHVQLQDTFYLKSNWCGTVPDDGADVIGYIILSPGADLIIRCKDLAERFKQLQCPAEVVPLACM